MKRELDIAKRLRTLSMLLIVSGALNIGLVICGVVSRFQEDRENGMVSPLAKKEVFEGTTMQPFFMQLVNRSFHELVSYLTNRDSLGEGYLKRDMAVSALVAFHHFNLEKALGGTPMQKRSISFNGGPKIEIFPGLSEEQFDAIIRFAYEEKWPLTAEGMFKLLKKGKNSREPSLEQAFFLTPEFHVLQVLFQRVDGFQDAPLLLQMVSEGPWEILQKFYEEQLELLDLSIEKRRSLLLSYLHQKSPVAASLLLRLDFPFVSKRLEDSSLLDLLSLCKDKTRDAERLCLELLHSPRTDAVWTKASQCLYAYAGEEVPSPWSLEKAIERFGSSGFQTVSKNRAPERSVAVETPHASPSLRYHVVKEGESLWKIARQYNVKVDQLQKMNELEKDSLYPGMTLRLP